MVEHRLAKARVASSNLVVRSSTKAPVDPTGAFAVPTRRDGGGEKPDSWTPERSGRVSPPPADVAQLVEHHLAKVRVAGSNPVVRSEAPYALAAGSFVAEWPSGLGKGLQSPVHGFDSRLRLTFPRVTGSW